MAQDSFVPDARVPTSVGSVEIILRVVAGTPNVYEARYSFDVLNGGGAILDVRSGNLVPHLTGAQITQTKAFMDAMLTKAQGAIG
ncbi:MAG: hypothetical protein NUW22_10810 [Acidobacteria bacterium]|nr:hypothetical protein [Acidobacteriota bacterium]